MEKRIRIADMAISDGNQDILIAEEIGSGMGLAIYDPVSRIGGILHFLLPDSMVDRKIAQTAPFLFADTAIPKFFGSFVCSGGKEKGARILAAGGAHIMDSKGVLDIGKQNYKALLDLLDRAGIRLDVEDIGGHVNRRLKLDTSTGDLFIQNSRDPREVKV